MRFTRFKDMILFENDQALVVNKPPCLASVDERGKDSVNLLQMAKGYWNDIQICHRLDKETSGALIFAKTPGAYRHISMQFERRQIKKVYHAIVEGTQVFKNLKVDLPILKMGKGHVAISKNEGKQAETYFNSIRYFKHFTLVECMPVTGRMHQIRIHLATQKACIVADEMYGGRYPLLSEIKKRGYKEGKNDEEQALIKRLALHARLVSFSLPSGEVKSIEAAYPKDLTVFIKLLDKFDV